MRVAFEPTSFAHEHSWQTYTRHGMTGRNKIVLPLSFGCNQSSIDQLKWGLKRFTFPNGKTSLYNLNFLREQPGKTVLIVEGEKSADAGMQMFNDMVTISWFGGVGGVKKRIGLLLQAAKLSYGQIMTQLDLKPQMKSATASSSKECNP